MKFHEIIRYAGIPIRAVAAGMVILVVGITVLIFGSDLLNGWGDLKKFVLAN
jgi:hypothetical protein